MSKARNRSLFLRLGLVLAAEPGLRLAGYLLTKKGLAELPPARFYSYFVHLKGSRSQLLSRHLVGLVLHTLCICCTPKKNQETVAGNQEVPS